MSKTAAIRLYISFAVTTLLVAAPAFAQFRPRPLGAEPATGERYHIEASAGFWNPSSEMSISSEALGIVGSTIDFQSHLGLESGRFRALKLLVRPGHKHKLRFETIPIKMSKLGHTLSTDLIFNGQRYPIQARLDSQFAWTATSIAYEYDFLYRDRWFVGFILDVKYTDVKAELQTAGIREFVHAYGPLPNLGGIARFYIAPNISITGEYTRMPVREQITDNLSGRYSDLNIHGTVNLTNYVGAQAGYRKFDVGYKFDDDSGAFKLNGLYFGIVARY